MNWLENLLDQNFVDAQTVALRLLLSLIFGGLIGLERESQSQSAGLRTHIMICMASALLTLVSIYIPQTFSDFRSGDPGRIAAQVVSGIGFLGAGAIFRLGPSIRGLTTAATIWTVAAIGLTVGTGMYMGALICTLFTLFALMVLGRVERRFLPPRLLKVLSLHFQSKKIETDEVFTVLEKYHIHVQSVNILQSIERGQTTMKLFVQIPKRIELKKLYKDLNALKDVYEIVLGQDF